MKRRFTGLLLAMCLVMALLPVTARAEYGAPTILVGGWGDHTNGISISTTEGGADVYVITNENGDPITEGATAENYNLKLEFKEGGKPTLYFRDAHLKALDKSGLYSKGDAAYPLDLVIESDSSIDAPWQGIEQFSGDLTIYGPGKLTINCDGAALCVKGTEAPGSLIVESGSLDLNSTNRFSPMSVGGGDIIINGGEMKMYCRLGDALNASKIYRSESTADGVGDYYLDGYEERGNIIINGGTIEASVGRNVLWSEGNITINGGNVNGTGESRAIVSEGNITITGGTSYFLCKHFTREAVLLESEDGTFAIRGGTVEITAMKAAFEENSIPTVEVSDNYYAVGGASAAVAKPFNPDVAAKVKYFKSCEGSLPEETTEATEAPTEETKEPAEETKENNTTEATGDSNVSDGNDGGDNTLVIVLASALVVVCAAIAVVIIKKKKAN